MKFYFDERFTPYVAIQVDILICMIVNLREY